MSLDLINSIKEFLPEIVLALTFLILILSNSIRISTKTDPYWITICGLGLALLLSVFGLWHNEAKLFSTQAALDPLSSFARISATAFSLFTLLILNRGNKTGSALPHEFYFFFVPFILSCILIASSINFITLFVSLILCDASVYFLLNIAGTDQKKILKFSVFSAFTTILILFGIAIIFGITGSTDYYQISYNLSINPFNSTTLLLVVLFLTVGIGAKILIAPLHFATRSIIDHVPVTLLSLFTGLLPVCSFAGISRIMLTTLRNTSGVNGTQNGFVFIPGFFWNGILITLAALSIIIATVGLLRVAKLRVLLFNISIIQSSLLLLGLASLSRTGFESSIGLAVSFMFLNLGLCYVISEYERVNETDEIRYFSGKYTLDKYLAATLLILMASSAGLPPTIGFASRLLVYHASIGPLEEWNLILQLAGSSVLVLSGLVISRHLFMGQTSDAGSGAEWFSARNIILLVICLSTIFGGLYYVPIAKSAVFFAKICGF